MRKLLAGLILLLPFTMLQPAAARKRGPRVEVVCPEPPIPVTVDDHRVLVYELHITNFDTVPLTLKRVDTFADTELSQPVQTLWGDPLRAEIFRVGTDSKVSDPETVAPGSRIVVFQWVELPPHAAAPRSLQHRIVFTFAPMDQQAGSAPVQTKLENFTVPVSREAVPVLSSPFADGTWVAGDGPGNDSPHRRALLAIDGHVLVPERFASDWVKVGPNGDSKKGTKSNQDYWAYGEPVLAVADGEVVSAVDGMADNLPHAKLPPMLLDEILGNYIVLRIAPDRYVTYCHLQQGSIKVAVHEHIKRGAAIALVGDSGQADGPHLHLQITDGIAPLQSEGVPFVFASYVDLGSGVTYETDKHPSNPRRDALPGENEVVEFGSVGKSK